MVRLGRYDFSEVAGEGGYGKVYKGVDTQTGEAVALKVARKADATHGVSCVTLREITSLKQLAEHPNIIKLYEVICTPEVLCLVFEYMEQDLSQYLRRIKLRSETIDPMVAKNIMFQMLHAITMCHAKRIIHRDLKPSNMLIQDEVLKLADFGLSKEYCAVPLQEMTPGMQTQFYRAPEVLLGCESYGQAVDLWSVGCIFAELFLLEPLFEKKTQLEQLLCMFHILGTPTKEVWPDYFSSHFYNNKFPQWPSGNLRNIMGVHMYNLGEDGFDLLQKLLTWDPKKRISAKEALSHPYFYNADMTLYE